jgi:hypothetical protein
MSTYVLTQKAERIGSGGWGATYTRRR